jgi:Mlc titration factor MtfA (ptsG expression regulator)
MWVEWSFLRKAEALSLFRGSLSRRNQRPVLDPYGAEDPAEFFAVATEAFFLLPAELEKDEPELYAVLRDSFRQDPARW